VASVVTKRVERRDADAVDEQSADKDENRDQYCQLLARNS